MYDGGNAAMIAFECTKESFPLGMLTFYEGCGSECEENIMSVLSNQP